jgi:hypothetical protein
MPDEWMDGYQWGYLHGLERGRAEGGDLRDAEWNERFGEAVRIVHAAAKWPDATRATRMERMNAAEREVNERLEQIRVRQGTTKSSKEEEEPWTSAPHLPVLRETTREGEQWSSTS